jgi:hypothetical protein
MNKLFLRDLLWSGCAVRWLYDVTREMNQMFGEDATMRGHLGRGIFTNLEKWFCWALTNTSFTTEWFMNDGSLHNTNIALPQVSSLSSTQSVEYPSALLKTAEQVENSHSTQSSTVAPIKYNWYSIQWTHQQVCRVRDVRNAHTVSPTFLHMTIPTVLIKPPHP